jgi:hypothetical protein
MIWPRRQQKGVISRRLDRLSIVHVDQTEIVKLFKIVFERANLDGRKLDERLDGSGRFWTVLDDFPSCGVYDFQTWTKEHCYDYGWMDWNTGISQ